MSDVRWVQQEDAWGCTLAAFAMILGRSYAEVRADFADFIACNEEFRGVTTLCGGEQYLAEQGYALARKFRYYLGVENDPWPPSPFGDVHLCDVTCSPNSPGSHSVVMLADGTVMDPLTPEPKRLADYYRVSHVSAVVRYR